MPGRPPTFSPALVSGGEALRLKNFLSEQNVPLPRIFHQMAKTPEEANESRVSGSVLLEALEAAMRALRRPSLPIDFGSTISASDMGIYGMVIRSATTMSRRFAVPRHPPRHFLNGLGTLGGCWWQAWDRPSTQGDPRSRLSKLKAREACPLRAALWRPRVQCLLIALSQSRVGSLRSF